MKTKKLFCLFAILVANNGFANNTNNFDVQNEYSKCMRSEQCRKRHNPNVWTNWDNIIEYMQITSKNLEKLKLEKKKKRRKKENRENMTKTSRERQKE